MEQPPLSLDKTRHQAESLQPVDENEWYDMMLRRTEIIDQIEASYRRGHVTAEADAELALSYQQTEDEIHELKATGKRNGWL